MSLNAILSINPGTTTTRCALYGLNGRVVEVITERTLDHDEGVMAGFPTIASQLDFRAAHIAAFLSEYLDDRRLVACAGRGGMLTPVPAGVIEVNKALVDFALHTPVYHHASNLGAPLAHALASRHGVPAFVVDPVSVDELAPVARVSGFDEIPRFSFVHALNIRACGRRLAKELNKPFDELRAVVAHLGAGFSIAALLNGRLVDSSNRMEISPFTPERAGGLPPLPLIELCFSGKYTREELLNKLYGRGGVFGMLGTKDIRRVETMIEAGDEEARLVFEAMLYQTAKAVGAMASVASFDLDGIILTGGLANSPRVTGYLTDKLTRLAPLHVYPGSDECRALAEGAARVLSGQETPLTWPIISERQVA
ncbi:butyrate kinase [Ruegeria sediminis]|uniref:Probable butyrate kinase n=1 Tax=Ruegeria sediminis TaxID=2583820 RepID=A0ABY2WT02_9RHOB|nr:butyrate kinase [Ruegeria sediminis]TMV04193.1 butyrate kinase [Ruegeria sediminis]